jgi:hypothetical protein
VTKKEKVTGKKRNHCYLLLLRQKYWKKIFPVEKRICFLYNGTVNRKEKSLKEMRTFLARMKKIILYRFPSVNQIGIAASRYLFNQR